MWKNVSSGDEKKRTSLSTLRAAQVGILTSRLVCKPAQTARKHPAEALVEHWAPHLSCQAPAALFDPSQDVPNADMLL